MAAPDGGAAGGEHRPALAERSIRVDGVRVFLRESPEPAEPASHAARAMMHVHGFGLSGRYLVPTAERLAGRFRTIVPDLPGFGRSGRRRGALDVPDLARSAVEILDELGIERATLVGNSMGCPVICEFAHDYPDRLERAVLVSPAGGLHNQPLVRAVGQLAKDGRREPTSLIRVVTPDYLRFGVPSTVRMFRSLTRYPTLERLLALDAPTLVVVGDRDPLMPSAARIREVAAHIDNRVVVVTIEGAAHAINFSHPDELARVIGLFMDDRPLVVEPGSPGAARIVEIHRGARGSAPQSE
ncbi:alpha/beta fold hydrolase [Agromyces sp. CFH 90414]|uniref:Alpha/beta fold hydrolase n=1 Tax=Agromyces agglutinans TaxID=2662258 RepID=A0A6I2F214_9MICO|nr:alpha/beta hydrolase [Agromyces agglutinans]MRG58522.1 alpha/beta fold hydrolase [Agromyces agglutinans]